MAGDGAPGPTRSLQGHGDDATPPSEGPDEQQRSRPTDAPGVVPPPPTDAPGGAPEAQTGEPHIGEPHTGEPHTEQTHTEQTHTEQTHTEETDTEEAHGGPPEGAAQPGSPPAEAPSSEPEPMRQAAFMGVVLELPNVHPSVVLQEIDAPMRELRVTVAQPDGVAIAYAWRGVATPRPLTHDLLTTILQRFGLQVDAVRITGVDGPVFAAELALSGPSGSHTVECRPSDALALALRQPLPVPIMVAEEVLVAAGRFPGA